MPMLAIIAKSPVMANTTDMVMVEPITRQVRPLMTLRKCDSS